MSEVEREGRLSNYGNAVASSVDQSWGVSFSLPFITGAFDGENVLTDRMIHADVDNYGEMGTRVSVYYLYRRGISSTLEVREANSQHVEDIGAVLVRDFGIFYQGVLDLLRHTESSKESRP